MTRGTRERGRARVYRLKLFEQWQDVTENIARRDQAIRQEGEEFAEIKMKINANKDALEERKRFLNNEKQDNKKVEMANTLLERQIIQQRSENKKIEEQYENQQADVEIQRNQLSAFASELQQKKNRCAMMS